MYPVLLLHGALGSANQLTMLYEALSQRGFTVYTMDFSGHGGKPFQSTFGIKTFANDVLPLLEENQIKRINVFGYSMGGYVALWMALQYPNLINKIITLGTKFDWNKTEAKKEVRKLDPDKILEKVPAFARLMQTRHQPNDWKSLIRKTSAMMVELGESPLLIPHNMKMIYSEVLVTLGDNDDMADRKYSTEVSGFIPKGKFMLLENTPHPIEKVDTVRLTGILENFFNG